MEAPAAKKVRVHFGSFEEQEKQRRELGGGGGRENGAVSAAVQAGIKAGNINIDGWCASIRIYVRVACAEGVYAYQQTHQFSFPYWHCIEHTC
jgi:hypothetical protein